MVQVSVQISVQIGRDRGYRGDRQGEMMVQGKEMLTEDPADLYFGPFPLEKAKRLWQGDRLVAVTTAGRMCAKSYGFEFRGQQSAQ
jgi:hypothetical protein